MAKLDAEKQALLDTWAAKVRDKTDKSAVFEGGKGTLAEDGKAPEKSDTAEMMESLGPLLTETLLDAAIAKAALEKPIDGEGE